MKDFTRARERLQFTIDDDTFEATPALPGQTLTEFARRFTDIQNAPTESKLHIITDVLSMVLLPDSAALFSKRFSDLKSPIELDQATDVLVWILEQYGLRPTRPSSSSASGPPSPASGTSSTDDAQPEVSIPATFQQTAT
jgi:hypothetical protein